MYTCRNENGGEDLCEDLVARALSSLKTETEYNSKTIALDQSHPPTPDGTGCPTNFRFIAPGIYRSSYPQEGHFERLEDLGLKTIITFVPQIIPLNYAKFISTHGIIHHHIPILANKDPTMYTSAETVHQVLELLLEPNNYPVLIHCNKGKHRTGCMTACFRKVCGWTDDAAIEEYVRHSSPKDRELDKVFIRRFDPTPLKSIALSRGYVGGVYKQPSLGESAVSEWSFTTAYTNNSATPYGSSDNGDIQHEYQERVRKENNDYMESSRLWSHR